MSSPTKMRNLEAIIESIPTIKLPPFPELTSEQLRLRGEAIDRMLENRDKMEPLGMSSAELIRQVRDELERLDE